MADMWSELFETSVLGSRSPLAQSPLSEQCAVLASLCGELALAVSRTKGTVEWSDLAPRQTPRTALNALRCEARKLAWVVLCHVPRGMWLLLSFCYRRIARYEASECVIARRAAVARRLRVRELRAANTGAL